MLIFYKNKNVWHINGWFFDNPKSKDKFFFLPHDAGVGDLV